MATPEQIRAVLGSPTFRELRSRRDRFGWLLAAVFLSAFFGFIVVSSLAPAVVAAPLAAGSSFTVGLAAVFIFKLSAIVFTAVYVRRANREYDRLTARLLSEIEK